MSDLICPSPAERVRKVMPERDSALQPHNERPARCDADSFLAFLPTPAGQMKVNLAGCFVVLGLN